MDCIHRFARVCRGATWGAWCHPGGGTGGWGWYHGRGYTNVNLNHVNTTVIGIAGWYRSITITTAMSLGTADGLKRVQTYLTCPPEAGERIWDANGRRVMPRPQSQTRSPGS
jgi:hypothetical protein